ncbi:hypothetical protein EDC94DRAFT_584623 [Helicostylum pulchrum]|nr:hypothetical protein EDC94DRAFT_584623 [Helicostylum pulchrum]
MLMTGRRIDLIIEAKKLEISTNEWRKDVCFASALRQQSKNICMNKALLKSSAGYMFVVSNVDVFVSNYMASLQLPTYIADIPDFIDTLDSFYVWKNHQIEMKDIFLVALKKKESDARLSHLIPDRVSQIESSEIASPTFSLRLRSDAARI